MKPPSELDPGPLPATVTSLLRRPERVAASRPVEPGARTNARVIPFAGAALRAQADQQQAASVDASNDAVLQDALLRVAESDSRSAEAEEARFLGLLLQALTEQRFEVHFQPQHCLASGRRVGIEALLRLADAKGGYLNTQILIDVAEKHDLIGLIGRHIMVAACSGYAELRRAGYLSGRLALNLSVQELRHTGYSAALLTTLADHGLAPTDIELEITETQPLDLPAAQLSQLVELAAVGVHLAVDDFGSGYANWASLARLPIRTVKLDRVLIGPLARCQRTAKIVDHLVRCGVDMGFRVLAEGVHSAAQQTKLLQLGCQVGQGFGLSAPAPVSELLDYSPKL